jgi:hypothetical protein
MRSVFIASTSMDLGEYRDAATEVVDLKWHAVTMRKFSAHDGLAIDECLRRVEGCQLMLLLVGKRWGTPAPGETETDANATSFVEREYRRARAARMPVLVFMTAEADWPDPQPSEPAEHRVRIERFRRELSHLAHMEFRPEKPPFPEFRQKVQSALHDQALQLEADERRRHDQEHRRQLWVWQGLAGAAIILGALISLLVAFKRVPEPSFVEVGPPPGMTFTGEAASVPGTQFALSPDGTRLAFVAAPAPGSPDGSRASSIFIRDLRQVQTEPSKLELTQGASYPFWSPDGQALAFFADTHLYRLDLGVDGKTRKRTILCQAPLGRGGAWGKSAILLAYGGGLKQPLYRIPDQGIGGGRPRTVATALEGGQVWHRWPQFVWKDGAVSDTFVYFVRNQNGSGEIHTAKLGPTIEAGRKLADTNLGAAYGAGHLLYLDKTDYLLTAAPFDPDGAGPVRTSEQHVTATAGGSSVQYASLSAAAQTGKLAVATGQVRHSTLRFVDRDGNEAGDPPKGLNDGSEVLSFRLAEDHLAVSRLRPQRAPELSIWSLSAGSPEWTSQPDEGSYIVNGSPVWSPTSEDLLFQRDPGGINTLHLLTSRAGHRQLQLYRGRTAEAHEIPTQWWGHPGARPRSIIVYQTLNRMSGDWDIQMEPPSPEIADLEPLRSAGSDELFGQLSPDGKMFAYSSNKDSTQHEVWLFAAGSFHRISVRGGTQPRWNEPDGRELFFIEPDSGFLCAVAIEPAASHPARPLNIGRPTRLFKIAASGFTNAFRNHYDVMPGGKKFLIAPFSAGGDSPITVMNDWSNFTR